jgi:hypothetical protein
MNTFKIFFLCEDSSAVNRAILLKEKLAANCRNKVIIEADFVEYARLCHPRIRENATLQATAAEMIIVTARGIDAVPEFVQNWMNQLVGLCPEKIVAAEFLQENSPEKTGVFHRFVEKWASQNGAFLFSNLFPGGHAGGLEAGFVEQNRLAESTFSPAGELFPC